MTHARRSAPTRRRQVQEPTLGDLRPRVGAKFKSRQLEQRHIRDCLAPAVLELLVLTCKGRQRLGVIRPPEQITVERFLRGALRLRMDHLENILQRRILPDGGPKQLVLGLAIEPVVDEAFRTGSERLAANSARPDDLDKVPEHSAVVDNAVKNQLEQREIPRRENGTEQRRHILHEALFSAIDRRLRNERGFDSSAQAQNTAELRLLVRIESRVQAARRRVLRQHLLGGKSVSRGEFLIDRIRQGNHLTYKRAEKILVRHDSFPPGDITKASLMPLKKWLQVADYKQMLAGLLPPMLDKQICF